MTREGTPVLIHIHLKPILLRQDEFRLHETFEIKFATDEYMLNYPCH